MAYNKIIIDASFIARLKRIEGCEFLDYFDTVFIGGECVVDEYQFLHGPCNDIQITCLTIDHLISDEGVIQFLLAYPGTKSLDLIYSPDRETGDYVDLKILALAYIERNSLVLSCDYYLLILCDDILIDHLCFKAAITILAQFDASIFDFNRYETNIMFEQDGDIDPFFHYHANHNCISCHPQNGCGYQNPPV